VTGAESYVNQVLKRRYDLVSERRYHSGDASSIFHWERIALRGEPATEKGSSSWGEIATLTSRGLGIATTMDTSVSASQARTFFAIKRIKPLTRSGGRSKCSLLTSCWPSSPVERTVIWPLGTSIERSIG
jgi:hypothetical protein